MRSEKPTIRGVLVFMSIAGISATAFGARPAKDNTLTRREKKDGWTLLFDGTLNGWMTNEKQPSKTPVEDGCINPHGSGGYMMVHEKEWSDFVLSLDFKISKGCNSGIFVRTFPLDTNVEVGWNGIETQILDSPGAGYYDTGALYDLVQPRKNAMKPVGEWNHIVINCNDNLIDVELNGEKINHMDLNEWTQKGRRPDGSEDKFKKTVWKDHPRHGYIGLQDHGSPVWFKNIKIKPLSAEASTRPSK